MTEKSVYWDVKTLRKQKLVNLSNPSSKIVTRATMVNPLLYRLLLDHDIIRASA